MLAFPRCKLRGVAYRIHGIARPRAFSGENPPASHGGPQEVSYFGRQGRGRGDVVGRAGTSSVTTKGQEQHARIQRFNAVSV
jgi:hypothetical protein